MARRKQQIQTHFERLMVVVNEGRSSGGGIHATDDLDRRPHRVLATFMYVWRDGSTTPAFLLETPDHQIVERACVKFKVVEVE